MTDTQRIRPPAQCALGLRGADRGTNAGKSTLVNRLVGAKVSIVSHKVQTTRAIIRGIAIHGSAQIVFMDHAGIFKPRRRLDRAMVTTAWGEPRTRSDHAADRQRARDQG